MSKCKDQKHCWHDPICRPNDTCKQSEVVMNKELREKVLDIMQSVYNAGARGEGISYEKGDELINLILDDAITELEAWGEPQAVHVIKKLKGNK